LKKSKSGINIFPETREPPLVKSCNKHQFLGKYNKGKQIIMAKRARRKAKRQTNWLVIGGIVVGGVILFAALIALALREPPALQLAAYCENNPENCIFMGPEDAAVTVVEVSDYGCSHCADFNIETSPILEDEYVETGQVRWIVLPFALQNQAGQYPTMNTAVAAMCANEQGAFSAFHKQAFELQSSPLFNSTEGFLQTAESVGMDVEAFSQCLASNDYSQIVLENVTMAQQAGVSATPTFFVNGEMLRGNQPLTVFQQRFDSLLNS